MTTGASDDSGPFPPLTTEQLAGLVARSTRQPVEVGDVLFAAGDRDYDFFTIETGLVAISRGVTPDDPTESVVAEHGPGRFLGEWNLMTGQAVYLTATVVEPGVVHRMSHSDFRLLLAQDAQLSDLILRALLARRDMLRAGAAASSVEIVGGALSATAHDLRLWAARQRLVHRWFDVDDEDGAALAHALSVTPADLPVVVTPTETLRNATPGRLAEVLGLSYRSSGRVSDVIIVGAGPAGLAAAVYGASEGLDTLLLDAVAVGGQAAASSRIENYLGFPSGLSGGELTARGLVQAQKFGALVSTPCRVTSLETTGGGALQLRLTDGVTMEARAVVLAMGAAYRTLPLPRWAEFEAAGIFYAATEIEARTCAPHPVAVVGAANSAGQAAIYLADRGSAVTLVVRGDDLAAGMSAYLVDRVTRHPQITVRTGTQVTSLHGGTSLEGITLTSRDSPPVDQECRGLFCFIGATPATRWLEDCGAACPAMDDKGFLLTDAGLATDALPEQWALLDRRPLPFETSVPGVFAVGDARLGSMKRVAAAVGEGASAIRSVHAVLAR